MHQRISFSALFIILLKETVFVILIWAAKMLKKTSVWRSSRSSNMLSLFYSDLVQLPFLLFRQNDTHLSNFSLARVLPGYFVKCKMLIGGKKFKSCDVTDQF